MKGRKVLLTRFSVFCYMGLLSILPYKLSKCSALLVAVGSFLLCCDGLCLLLIHCCFHFILYFIVFPLIVGYGSQCVKSNDVPNKCVQSY